MKEVCELVVNNICYIKAQQIENSIFGFAEFVAAFSILMALYTITDMRYKFRIWISPTSFNKPKFLNSLIREVNILALFISAGTLLTDVWFSKGWLIPNFLNAQEYWQTLFAFAFASIVFTWIYHAFINPPIFSTRNYRKFFDVLYHEILRGSEKDLPEIAYEMWRSAQNIIKYSYTSDYIKDSEEKIKNKPDVGVCAHELLRLIGSKMFCKYVVSNTPITAVAFFEEIEKNKKYNLPIEVFAKNVFLEALANKNSVLYHEDEGYDSGLIGYIKPFRKPFFGNCKLITGLSQNPFDIGCKELRSLDADQLEIYTKCFLVFVEDCLINSTIDTNSMVFNRTLENIVGRSSEIKKVNGTTDFYDTNSYQKFTVITKFVEDLIKILNEKDKSIVRRRIKSFGSFNDYYDSIANAMFEIILDASSVKDPVDTNWWIQHNTVWTSFFIHFDKGNAQKIVHFRLRRLIYDEIKRLEKFPNYQSIKALGFCLNIMDFTESNEEISYNYRSIKALHKCVLSWTKKNYLKVRKKNIDVAKSGLMGRLSFDEKKKRLVKTYEKGLNSKAPKDYLNLSNNKRSVRLIT